MDWGAGFWLLECGGLTPLWRFGQVPGKHPKRRQAAALQKPCWTTNPQGSRRMPMGVIICLPLFGPPDRELEEQAVLQGRHLRKLAAELNDRLQRAADILDLLTANGWK